MIRPLAIFGAGGFTLQMLDSLETEAAAGRRILVIDDAIREFHGFPTIAPADLPVDAETVIAIADPRTRQQIADRLAGKTGWGRLVAETAKVSRHASIGEGAIVAHFAVIEAEVRVGRHFHANLYSYVAHESVIGDYVTFAPRVSCNGRVHIGDHVYIGTGAMIRQGRAEPLRIGAGTHIGMGAIITRDVPEGAIVRAMAAH